MPLACQAMFMRLAVLCMGLLALPATAQEKPVPLLQPGSGWSASYDVWTGGFRALAVDLTLRTTAGGYTADMKVRTDGFIGNVAPWHAEAVATGTLSGSGRPSSDRYSNTSTWAGKKSVTALDWQGDGSATITFQPQRDLPEDISPADGKDASDPLTAVLGGLDRVARRTALCPDPLRIFDGRRRFDVRMAPASPRSVPASDKALYAGPARVCRLGVTPLAGAWRWRSSGALVPPGGSLSDTPDAFLLYFAQPSPDLPTVPVRVEGNTSYGPIVAYLTALKKL